MGWCSTPNANFSFSSSAFGIRTFEGLCSFAFGVDCGPLKQTTDWLSEGNPPGRLRWAVFVSFHLNDMGTLAESSWYVLIIALTMFFMLWFNKHKPGN